MQQLVRNGVSLAYEDTGRGTPSLIFIHGMGCDHTHFAPQLAHERDNHRVVAVDLRGYGQSDKPKQDYSIAGFADDVAWLCRELEIHRPVIVGHSMGSMIALDLAARRSELPAAIVALDAPLFVSPPVAEARGKAAQAMWTPAYQEVLRAYFSSRAFAPTDDPERRERILAGMCALPQYVIASTFTALHSYDTGAAAAACKVPLLYIGAMAPIDLDHFRRLCPQLVVGRTVGAGHWHQLEVPEQVNAMIDRFLAVGLGQPAVATEVGAASA
jgi:pimeloyl-ACP methyl ester carboxylesterase